MRDDLFGLLLDLPHPFEIADGVGVVFDAKAEQGADGGFEHAGEPIERLDLDDLAGLDPVDRGARHPEAFGDLLRREDRAPSGRHVAFHRFRQSGCWSRSFFASDLVTCLIFETEAYMISGAQGSANSVLPAGSTENRRGPVNALRGGRRKRSC